MADISTLYGKQFEDNIRLGAQQLIAKFRDRVIAKTGVKGKSTSFGIVDEESARKKTGRHTDTIYDDPSHTRVTCYLDYWYKALMLDPDDELKVVADPKSSYVQTSLAALRRQIDASIITAINGTKYTGEKGTTQNSLPSGRKIAASSAGLTIAKLISALELFNDEDVDENEPKFIAIGPKQLSDLLNLDKVTSADYNTLKALVPGKVVQFMGFNFVLSTQLAKSGDDRLCLAWAKTGVGLAIGQDIVGRVDEVQVKHYAWSTYASMYIGATRIEDEKVVEIACLES
jgi:hypothetical protein